MDLSSLTDQGSALVQTILVQVVIPLAVAAFLSGLAWASTRAAKYIGTKNADALKALITGAIINNLSKTAGTNTPGTPSFEGAVVAATEYAKLAYPDAIKKLGAKDGPLQTIAAAELNKLIVAGLAKVAIRP